MKPIETTTVVILVYINNIELSFDSWKLLLFSGTFYVFFGIVFCKTF